MHKIILYYCAIHLFSLFFCKNIFQPWQFLPHPVFFCFILQSKPFPAQPKKIPGADCSGDLPFCFTTQTVWYASHSPHAR